MPSLAPLDRRAWVHLLWIGPIGVLLAAGAALLANVIRNTPAVADFLVAYPGTVPLPDAAPTGFPVWLSIQHFLSAFFLLLIIRTGFVLRRRERPTVFWTRNRFVNPAKPPRRMSLTLWLHLTLDVLWVVNGAVYYVLLFATGQWMRLVPLSWDVIPNALSATLQYVSLDWPYENGWINYNSLQLLAYFATVFIAAPLAIATGIRLSSIWPQGDTRLNRLYPERWARALHFPVMVYFLLFIVAHVTLVFATGALRNLNHMFGGRDDESWIGAGVFAVSVVVMIVGWMLARPAVLKKIASWTGTVR